MFEQLEDLREKPPVKRWHVINVVLCIFMLGIQVGILLGRRNWHWEPWLQTSIYVLILWRIAAPLVRAISTQKQVVNNDH